MKKILAFLLTLSLAFVLLGCVKDVKPTSVEITGAKDMVVGDSLTLTAKVLPDDAKDKTVKWSSDNAEVATVSAGTVKALKEGTVNITAKATADEKVAKTVTIKITKAADVDPTEIKVTGLADIEVGKSIKLVVEVLPSGAKQEVEFKSNNEAIAKVDANGNVTGVALGEATITVSSKAKAEIKKEVTIKVVEKAQEVLPTSIKVTGETKVLVGKTVSLTVEVTPKEATNKEVEFKSSNEAIATVDAEGVVKGVKAGEVTITVTAKAKADVTAKITIKVEKEKVPGAPEYIQITGYKKNIKVGDTMELVAYLYSNVEEVTLSDYEWETDPKESDVAKIENGLFTALKAGTVSIKCLSTADKDIYSSIKITVVDDSEEYVYDVESLEYTFKKTEFLLHESIASNMEKKILPDKLDNKDVYWESSDTKVVKISPTYRTPYIVGVGEVTITAFSAANPDISKEYTIVVKPYAAPTSFKVVDSMGEEVTEIKDLEVSRRKTISVSVEPEDGDPRATFESLNKDIATIDANGQILAVAEGETTIIVKSAAEGVEFEKQIKITVIPKKVQEIKVEYVEIEVENKTYVGYKLKAVATVYPTICPQGVTWEIHKTSTKFATINEEGMIVPIAEGTIKVRAVSQFDPSKKSAWKAITIEKPIEPFPVGDLKGYKIIIMNADSALQDNDPFYHKESNGIVTEYTQADKLYKQKAWKEVQDKYNCEIVVEAYPPEAPWGAQRIKWIIDNATNGTSKCDLGIIATNWIPQFGAANAAVDVTEMYERYGMSQIEPALKTAGSYKGKLLVASTGISSTNTYVSLGLFYNYGWLKKLGVKDPATMFNNGEWTYTGFTNWVISTQAVLGENEHVLQGSPYYYWFGMTNAAGIQVVDANMATVNVDDEKSIEASNVIYNLVQHECVLKPQVWAEQSESEYSFHKGKTLMTTGDIWFIRNAGRWTKDMWGEGTTEYAYVPFPYPDTMAKEDTRVSVANYSAYMYIAGRQYPEALGKEGYNKVWSVMNEMFLNTIKYQEEDTLFDAKAVMENSLKNRLDNPASIEAVLFYDAKRVLFDPAHGIYSSVSATPLKSAANNAMYEGKDYIEEFEKVREQFETDVKKFYAA